MPSDSPPLEETATEAYYLEQVTLDDDEDDDFEYTEVENPDGEEDFKEDEEDDENLEQALASIKAKEEKQNSPMQRQDEAPRPSVSRRPEVVDDFIRNVLLKLGALPLMPAPCTASSLIRPLRACFQG